MGEPAVKSLFYAVFFGGNFSSQGDMKQLQDSEITHTSDLFPFQLGFLVKFCSFLDPIFLVKGMVYLPKAFWNEKVRLCSLKHKNQVKE